MTETHRRDSDNSDASSQARSHLPVTSSTATPPYPAGYNECGGIHEEDSHLRRGGQGLS